MTDDDTTPETSGRELIETFLDIREEIPDALLDEFIERLEFEKKRRQEESLDIPEKHANHPGINDLVEVQAYARRQEELARARGRENAEADYEHK